MTPNERVKLLITKMNLSQKKFAQLLGISPPRLHNYLSGIRYIPQEIIVKIVKLTGCEYKWLLTGEGSMFQKLIPVDSSFLNNMIHLPVVSEIAAGQPVEVLSEEPLGYIDIPRSLLNYPPPYLAFRVSGNSMKPLLLNGDLVICSQDWRNQHLSGKIMAFRTADGITLKKLFLDPKTRTTFLLPINDEYNPIIYTPDDDDLYLLAILDILIRPFNRE